MSEDRFRAVVTECEIARDALLQLDPGGNYSMLSRRDLGLSEASDLFAGQDTLLAETCEHFESWKNYLAGRHAVLTERAAFRARLDEPALPDLDAVSDAITDDPASVAEVGQENARQRVDAIQRTRENERLRLKESQR
jgi:hypothetical protein